MMQSHLRKQEPRLFFHCIVAGAKQRWDKCTKGRPADLPQRRLAGDDGGPNGRRTQDHVNINGAVHKLIDKSTCTCGQCAGGYLTRDRPRETRKELKVTVRGLPYADQGDYIRHALPCMVNKICALTGLVRHKGACGIAATQDGSYTLQFQDSVFANLFFLRYNNFQDEQGGRLLQWTLANDKFAALASKEPLLLALKNAVKAIDVQAFEATVDQLQRDDAAPQK